jgi:hypothetical protein
MRIFIISILLVFSTLISAQSGLTIKGVVTDAETDEPIPFAGVEINQKTRTTTDLYGNYSIVSKENNNKIKFSCVGYKTEFKSISPGKSQIINVKLKTSVTELEQLVVKPKKARYRNKDNPAVELIENVIKNKQRNRKENLDFYEYERYQKTQFALSNFGEKLKNRKILKKFKFVFENVDSTKLAGVKILPVYLKETLSDFYFRKNPESNREVVKANKMVSFEGYVDEQGFAEYLKFLYQDINIYNNDIMFLSNMFVSPIAPTAPTLYKYFITDTTIIDSTKCIKLLFTPRNKADMLFQGYLFIAKDSSHAVKRLEMSVNKDINLNWVKDVEIVQQFDSVQNKGWLLTTDNISIDFGLTKNSFGIYGQRSSSYKNYEVNIARGDSIYNSPDKIIEDDADKRNLAYWDSHRHEPLTKSEKGVYVVVDSVKRIPAFRRTMDVMMLLFSGYRDMGYFEIGPVNTFYSYNPIEGARLRFGGHTTPKFSKKINFETYVAYGFFDENIKYYLGTTYSLTNRTIYNFPVKSVKFSIQDETKIPGQELQFVQEDNILLSIKRGINDKLLYNKTYRFEHLNEFSNHFSYTLGLSYLKQSPAGALYFNNTGYLDTNNRTSYINVTEASINLRYAPHEQFYQGKIYRIPIINKYPVFQLQYTLGSKALGNDYNYQTLKLNVTKRFYPWIFGYTDVILEGGKVFGKVPYPLLVIHRANQTYSYQISSYNLMNFLEFVSDQYVSLNVDHCFNGFIFNKIPLIKKLKFREVVTCKVLYGSLSNKNNPDDDASLFKFPVTASGVPLTYTLEKKPYIEASVGVANILKFFRVDLVKRINYLDHPDVTEWGLRARFKFDF